MLHICSFVSHKIRTSLLGFFPAVSFSQSSLWLCLATLCAPLAKLYMHLGKGLSAWQLSSTVFKTEVTFLTRHISDKINQRDLFNSFTAYKK